MPVHHTDSDFNVQRFVDVEETVETHSNQIGNWSLFRPNDPSVSSADKTKNEFTDRGYNIKWYGATDSNQTTTGTINAGSNTLTVTDVKDFAVDHGIAILQTAGTKEIVTLQFTAAAATSGFIRITLHRTPRDIWVNAGETAIQIADKLRALGWTGWNTGGTTGTDTVTFTQKVNGVCIDSVFSGQVLSFPDTGVTATATMTTKGTADVYFISKITAINGLNLTLRDNAPVTLTSKTVNHDNSIAVKDAITAAEATGDGKVTAPNSLNGFKLYNGFTIDVQKSSFGGEHAVFDCSGMTGGTVITLTAGTNDYANRYKNVREILKRVVLKGGVSGSPLLSTGIFIGTPTSADNSSLNNLLLDGVVAQGFYNNLEFGHNAWRIYVENSMFKWGRVYAPSGLSNFGENMHFKKTLISDGGARIDLGGGFWNFDGCSMDNCAVRNFNNAVIHINGQHLENPGGSSKGYRMISVEASGGSVFVSDCDLIFANPSGGVDMFDRSLYYVIDTNTQNGLHFSNCKYSFNANYDPTQTDGNKTLVGGKGRVTFKGAIAPDAVSNFIIAESMNALYNGDAEVGTTSGWTTTGTGSFTVDTAEKKSGTKSFKLAVTGNQSISATQDFDVKPQQVIMLGLWYKRSNMTGSVSFTVKTEFYSKSGVKISENAASYTTNTDWANKSNFMQIAPVGTAYGKVTVNLNAGTSGTGDVWVDDMIVNVI